MTSTINKMGIIYYWILSRIISANFLTNDRNMNGKYTRTRKCFQPCCCIPNDESCFRSTTGICSSRESASGSKQIGCNTKDHLHCYYHPLQHFLLPQNLSILSFQALLSPSFSAWIDFDDVTNTQYEKNRPAGFCKILKSNYLRLYEGNILKIYIICYFVYWGIYLRAEKNAFQADFK